MLNTTSMVHVGDDAEIDAHETTGRVDRSSLTVEFRDRETGSAVILFLPMRKAYELAVIMQASVPNDDPFDAVG